jgi:hypothetical protein
MIAFAQYLNLSVILVLFKRNKHFHPAAARVLNAWWRWELILTRVGLIDICLSFPLISLLTLTCPKIWRKQPFFEDQQSAGSEMRLWIVLNIIKFGFWKRKNVKPRIFLLLTPLFVLSIYALNWYSCLATKQLWTWLCSLHLIQIFHMM